MYAPHAGQFEVHLRPYERKIWKIRMPKDRRPYKFLLPTILYQSRKEEETPIGS